VEVKAFYLISNLGLKKITCLVGSSLPHYFMAVPHKDDSLYDGHGTQ
jgi:hypothetical protein